MLVPAVHLSPLLVAVVIVGCIPKEREEDHRVEARTVTPTSTPRLGTAHPAPTADRANDTAGADPDELLTRVFSDRFDREALGPDWRATAGAWHVEGGRLCATGARNHPVWLARRIPMNARIEFDALSHSADGDIKVEVWGNGISAATGTTYGDATSYLAIFGGWRNRFHVLARLDEHGADRIQQSLEPEATELRHAPVVAGRLYHFTIERFDGRTLRWLVNGQEVAVLEDNNPLVGPGHDHFGFNDWETPVCFDNLTLTPF